MLKSKTSRWLAGPYLLWMAAFIIVPLFIVIWYALTNADGRSACRQTAARSARPRDG